MLGFNAEQVYRDEISDLSKNRGKIDWNLGDMLREQYGNVIGQDYSREGIRKGAAALLEADINERFSDAQGTVREGLGGTGIDVSDLDIKQGETEKAYKSRLAGLQSKGTAASTYLQTPGANAASILPGMSTNQILGLATNQAETNRVNAENKVITRENNLLERTDLKEERADIRQDRRLAQERALTADTNRMQLQFQYAQLMQNDRIRAQDRRDKSLMALIQGVGNLGAAFTI
tara:strand:+ start:169 stop:870 length:702 start_codon:yes stop_codon:yes gene_type:complete